MQTKDTGRPALPGNSAENGPISVKLRYRRNITSPRIAPMRSAKRSRPSSRTFARSDRWSPDWGFHRERREPGLGQRNQPVSLVVLIRDHFDQPVCTENLSTAIVVMKSAQDGA